MLPVHPIMQESFAVIDREIGNHNFSPAEYAIVRRVIHSTADFEFKDLIRFSPGAIETAIAGLQQGVPVVTDVGMVKQGVANLLRKTFNNPLLAAVECASSPLPGKTRSATGMLKCALKFPNAIFVIGNAPTALLALCSHLNNSTATLPTLIIGAPVGFVSVIESKAALAQTSVPQIRVEGRKGGSPVAAAILNALVVLASEKK
ncbi:MAG: cobalt-precorrin-8X methylmutase [Oscillatoriaceae bacterium SKW80]|nr:cobalt-precorrin-8X methylmutase [Oscillatoriaceae bacterium SKYG93]MCX8121133.1 cobalt-precorrin-8X methylmutase [Oscillatoriaceae bacterium SKW80]MDW8453537.1 cobalt-precorrin-8X methylmutase [Oscillatoriaceae cyanobacterium SKYGB_i_bin93]HIK26888.1 cobalt-precorrin-8X methylmutase [Oscillatoriaceae cyanobacterium M7585_C2015_266]